MACHVVRFQKNGSSEIQWGVLEEKIYPIAGDYSLTADFIAQGKDKAFTLQADIQAGRVTEGLNVEEVTLLPPVTKPCQVLCQGANYRKHMIESGMNPDDKKFNMFFNKSAASISGPNTDIIKPEHVRLLDYEVELGLVIGASVTEAQNFQVADLSKVIAGIVIGNDVSARDVQVPQMQFYKGKSYRTFCPVGPYLCLLKPEEIKYLDQLELKLTVNGEVRQSDNTKNLVFKPAETLSELSQVTDLNVGDLVMTGTPAGCAMRIPSPVVTKVAALLPEATKWKMFKKTQSKRRQYLQAGDIVRTTIASLDGVIDLGVQENRVV